jgi:hypothetical protein
MGAKVPGLSASGWLDKPAKFRAGNAADDAAGNTSAGDAVTLGQAPTSRPSRAILHVIPSQTNDLDSFSQNEECYIGAE